MWHSARPPLCISPPQGERKALAPLGGKPERGPHRGLHLFSAGVCAPVLFALVAALAVIPASAQQLPEPVGYVNDFAGVFSADIKSGLEDSLRLFEQETTVELAVVTVPNMSGTTVEEYAARLFEKWGIGKKDVDNGILLLFAQSERRVRIEVGYGMEPYLTDGQAGRILDNEVLPDLRAGNYGLGLLKGTRAIAQTIKDSDYQPGDVRPRSSFPRLPSLVANRAWVLWLLGGLSMYLLSFMGRTRSIWLGGLWGAASGATLGWAFNGSILLMGGIAAGAAGLGLLLDLILSSAYRYQRSSGGPTSWARTWGGFSGAGRGGWGGGGSGGFGGGRSGGGGASRGF